MKNLGKILGIILVVALLCSAFIFAISAETANEAVIVETGVEYETYSAAMLAVESGQTVKLLKDIAPDAGNGASTKVITIDLNGYTVDLKNATGWFMSVGQNTEQAKHAEITIKNGNFITTAGCGILKTNSASPEAVANMENVNITAITTKVLPFDCMSGTMNLYNVNVTADIHWDNGFLKNSGGIANITRCNFYTTAKTVGFKLGGESTTTFEDCEAIIENYDGVGGTAQMFRNTSTCTAETHPKLIVKNCYMSAVTSSYKGSQFMCYDGNVIDAKFYDSTLLAQWRAFIFSKKAESDTIDAATLYFENCNIGSPRLNNNSSNPNNIVSGSGGDNCLLRGGPMATFNNCDIYIGGGSSVNWGGHTTDAGVPNVTYGPGTTIHTSSAYGTTMQGLKNGTTDTAWTTTEGYDLCRVTPGGGGANNSGYSKFVIAPTGTTSIENQANYSYYNFDGNWMYSRMDDPTYADGKTTGVQMTAADSFGYILRGGLVRNGHTMSDCNNYFIYTPGVDQTFKADPYFNLQYLNSGNTKYIKDVSYLTYEFDVMTLTEIVNNVRVYINFRTDSGTTNTSGSVDFKTEADGNTYIYGAGANTSYKLDTTPGRWTHITAVMEFGAATESGTVPTGKFAIYANGQRIYDNQNTAWDPSANQIGELRIHNNKGTSVKGTDTICFDNLAVAYYNRNYTGALTGIFNETGAVDTLPECAEIEYSSTYKMPAGLDIAYVNGAYYDDINEAIKAADGEVVELLNNVTNVTITEAGKVKAGEYTFQYNLDGVYAATADGVVTFGEYTGSEHANIYWVPNLEALEDEEFDWDAALEEVIWGQQLVCPEEYTADYVKDGKVYTLVGFVDDYENVYETLPVSSSAIDEFSFIPVFEPVGEVLFTIDQGGKTIAFGTEATELSMATTSIKADDGAATVTLYGDVVGKSIGFAVVNDLNFDFNGYKVIIENKTNFFEVKGAVKLNVYSSKEGAAFMSYAADTTMGAPLVYVSTANSTITIGDGTDNLSVYASSVFDTADVWSAITLNGGTYVRNVSDYSGFLIARGNQNITVKDATIAGCYGGNVTRSQGRACSFTFENTTFVSTNVKGEKYACNLLGAGISGDTYTFTNCQAIGYNINVPTGLTVSIDEKTVATSIAAGVVLPEGYKVALVDREATATVNYNEFWSENMYEVVAHNLVGNINAALVTEDTVLPEMTGMLQNLTLYAGYNVNLYVPKVEGIVALSKSIDTENLMDRVVTIEGKEYYMITDYVNANAITSDVSFYITFAGEEAYAQKVAVNVVDYAEEILSRGFSDEAKTLMVTMLAYSNEAYTLLNGAANAEIAAIVDANAVYALPEFTVPGEPIDVSVLANAITAAQLNLDASPDFVFTVNKAFAGTITVTYASANGQTVTKTFEVAAVTDEAAAANVITISDIRMYDIGETLNIKATPVEGEAIEGTYNLATYILGLEATDVNASFAKALYAYGVAAALYREYIVG